MGSVNLGLDVPLHRVQNRTLEGAMTQRQDDANMVTNDPRKGTERE
jgi:hypothetical protein